MTNSKRLQGQRNPLLKPDWQYIEKWSLELFRKNDWETLNRQRALYMAEQQTQQVLEMFCASQNAATFGYAINNYEHGLQTASLMLRDGFDEETVVCGLLHDIAYMICPSNHHNVAAELLAPFVSEKNRWMIAHHQAFQKYHFHEIGADRNERERWRGHPYFDWTAEFVAKYDIVTINPEIDSQPLEAFIPMMERLFRRQPREIELS